MCFLLCFHLVQGSRFRALVAASPPFLLGDARKWYFSHQSLLRYEGRNRLTCMVSDPSAQSLPVLAVFFSHRAFLSAQDDDTGERVVSQGGGFAAFFIGRCPKVVFKSRVTSHNNDTSRPLETEVPQRDFRVWPNPKRRLACPLRRLPVRPNGPRQRRRMDPRSGVKNYVRLSVSLKRHPDRSGGIFLADW